MHLRDVRLCLYFRNAVEAWGASLPLQRQLFHWTAYIAQVVFFLYAETSPPAHCDAGEADEGRKLFHYDTLGSLT